MPLLYHCHCDTPYYCQMPQLSCHCAAVAMLLVAIVIKLPCCCCNHCSVNMPFSQQFHGIVPAVAVPPPLHHFNNHTATSSSQSFCCLIVCHHCCTVTAVTISSLPLMHHCHTIAIIVTTVGFIYKRGERGLPGIGLWESPKNLQSLRMCVDHKQICTVPQKFSPYIGDPFQTST